jgi:hypothetical protein
MAAATALRQQSNPARPLYPVRQRALSSRRDQRADARNAIAQKMIDTLEAVAFDNKSVDKLQAERLIVEADLMIASVH